MASTKIDLITGFLGAGKTTLIRRYTALLRAGGVSCAVIENEFGAAGVDAAVLERDVLYAEVELSRRNARTVA